jgi:sulfur carrier protein ThiS
MRIKIIIYPNKRIKEIDVRGKCIKVAKLLSILGYEVNEVVVKVNETLVTEDDDLCVNNVEIYEVVSSG